MKRISGKNEKNERSYITNVLVQRISLQLSNNNHQINFSVQMNVCTGQNGSTVAGQKDNERDKVSWGEFLRVVITGEYNDAYF